MRLQELVANRFLDTEIVCVCFFWGGWEVGVEAWFTLKREHKEPK